MPVRVRKTVHAVVVAVVSRRQLRMVDLTVEDRRSPVVAVPITVRVGIPLSIQLSIQTIVHVIQRCTKVLPRGQFRSRPELTERLIGRGSPEGAGHDVVHFVV